MSKEYYRTHFPKNTPFFHQPFWLDLILENNWNVILATEKEKIIGSFVYYFESTKYTSKISIKMPPLTFNMGPHLFDNHLQIKTFDQINNEIKFLEQIEEKLPEFAFFYQKWDCQQQNWLPFYWKNFSQTTKYTYVIDDITNIKNVWENFKGSVRTDIRKAEKKIKVIDGGHNYEALYDLIIKTFERQNIKEIYPKKLIEKIITGCHLNNSGKLFLGIDENNEVQSAVFIVWDNNKAYYLIGASDPKYRTSGVNSLLLWEAIKFCSTFVKSFDFEGSMIKNIEYFFRSFGATQKAYFEISKDQRNKTKVINLFKKIIS